MEPLFPGRLLLAILCWTRFLHANRYPLRSKTLLPYAAVRFGSSTMEKRMPALWRLSSETSRQQSSASLRDLNGPLTWAEPSTSLWKFIEPYSPPITQKLLPVVMTRLLLSPLAELVHRVVGAARLQGSLTGKVSFVI